MLARTLTDLAPLFLFLPCQLFTAPASVCRPPSDLPQHGFFLMRSECLFVPLNTSAHSATDPSPLGRCAQANRECPELR